MLTVMLLVLAYADSWQFTETDIFQPLRPEGVTVHPDGSVYIRNFADAQIIHLDKSGKLIKTFGRKGKGPGEFTFPRYVNVTNDKLYVYDLLNAQISVFKADGTFIERLETPDRGLALAKGSKGWLYGTWGTFSDPNAEGEAKAEIVWVDESFKNPKTLVSDLDKGQGQGSMVFQNNSDVIAIYSPIDTYPLMVNDANYAYISHPSDAKIFVYDYAAQKMLEPITFEHRPIPFDTDWADEQFEEAMSNSRTSTVAKGDWKKAYPEKFPAIRRLYIDPDGNLVVDRWRGRPDDNHYLLTLNRKGEVLPNTYDADFLERYMGKSSDDHVYISIFDPAEEMGGIARVPKAQAVEFAAKNPIEYDGDTGYSISISN